MTACCELTSAAWVVYTFEEGNESFRMLDVGADGARCFVTRGDEFVVPFELLTELLGRISPLGHQVSIYLSNEGSRWPGRRSTDLKGDRSEPITQLAYQIMRVTDRKVLTTFSICWSSSSAASVWQRSSTV